MEKATDLGYLDGAKGGIGDRSIVRLGVVKSELA